MSAFDSIFGPLISLFVATKGAEAAVSPPPDPAPSSAASNGDLYGSGGSMYGSGDASSMWGQRVEEKSSPPADLGM